MCLCDMSEKREETCEGRQRWRDYFNAHTHTYIKIPANYTVSLGRGAFTKPATGNLGLIIVGVTVMGLSKKKLCAQKILYTNVTASVEGI